MSDDVKEFAGFMGVLAVIFTVVVTVFGICSYIGNKAEKDHKYRMKALEVMERIESKEAPCDP